MLKSFRFCCKTVRAKWKKIPTAGSTRTKKKEKDSIFKWTLLFSNMFRRRRSATRHHANAISWSEKGLREIWRNNKLVGNYKKICDINGYWIREHAKSVLGYVDENFVISLKIFHKKKILTNLNRVLTHKQLRSFEINVSLFSDKFHFILH